MPLISREPKTLCKHDICCPIFTCRGISGLRKWLLFNIPHNSSALTFPRATEEVPPQQHPRHPPGVLLSLLHLLLKKSIIFQWEKVSVRHYAQPSFSTHLFTGHKVSSTYNHHRSSRLASFLGCMGRRNNHYGHTAISYSNKTQTK